MRVFLLNQFVPPAQPPTAMLVGDLAAALAASGHEVHCIGSSRPYAAARGAKRILRDVGAHFRIACAVLSGGRCDWIVALSDPTGLPVTARVLAMIKGASLAHWAMDVYPQTAVALGVVRQGLLTRLIAAAMHFAYRGCKLLVALDRDMKAEIAAHSRRPVAVLPPWPPEVAAGGSTAKTHQGRRWLYSGNLGRAHEFETLLQAQKILEDRGADWELCFQGSGPSRAEAERLAVQLGLKRCRWSDYVSAEELLTSLTTADVLIATQRPETRGLLWPSKLSLMRHLSVPIAWVGPVQGAIADWLRQQDTACGIFAPGEAAAVADWLGALPPSVPAEMRAIHEKVRTEREAGTQWWVDQLSSTPGAVKAKE